MKNLLFFIIICFNCLSAYAITTEASKFAENEYSKQTGYENVHINVKKEHTIENLHQVGEHYAPAITFGYGDMKIKRCKKSRISYICLLDKSCKPFWSYIFITK